MTDPVPSKDLLADLNDTRNECHNRGLHGCASDVQRAIEEIGSLQRQVEALSIHSAKWVTRALELQQRPAPEPAADLLAAAERIVADYARRNPKWSDLNGVVQDPWGAHAWLERYRAAQPPRDGQ